MTPESALTTPSADASASTADSSTSAVVDSSSTQAGTATPPESTAGDVTTAVQGTASESDPLAGVPSIEELNQLPDTVQHKKSLIQLREAIEKQFKPQLNELTQKFSVFEPVADRFQKPEELQALVELQDSLFGYERDAETQQLIPATEKAASLLNKNYRTHADFLAADLLNMETVDPGTGQQKLRSDLMLEYMAQDPERRQRALQILGGVEPSQLAPTWAPTPEELNDVKPEFHDLYKSLPWEEREEIKALSPEGLNRYLAREKQTRDIEANAQRLEQAQQQAAQRAEQQQRHLAQEAGNKYVEEQFRTGFTEFANSVVSKAQFIQPLAADSPEAQQLGPEGAQRFNESAARVNKGVGTLIAAVTAALSHPDTSWVISDVLTQLGTDPKAIQGFNSARQEFANNARMYGELSYGRNGQGAADLAPVQSNASRALNSMRGYGNAISATLFNLMNELFTMRADNYNATLNNAVVARPPVNGQAYNAATAPLTGQQPQGWKSHDEFQRLYG